MPLPFLFPLLLTGAKPGWKQKALTAALRLQGRGGRQEGDGQGPTPCLKQAQSIQSGKEAWSKDQSTVQWKGEGLQQTEPELHSQNKPPRERSSWSRKTPTKGYSQQEYRKLLTTLKGAAREGNQINGQARTT